MSTVDQKRGTTLKIKFFSNMRYKRCVRWGKTLIGTLSLVVALLPLPAPAAPLHRAPPALLTIAATAPTQPVRIIVQKATALDQPEAAVARLGGVVIRELAFINAFVAQVPAVALPALAARADIRWISPDAPVANSGSLTMPQATPHPGLLNTYIPVIKADKAWQKGLKGQWGYRRRG